MSGLQVIKTTISGYGQHGQDVLSEEAFVKVLVSFDTDGSLRRLKGAPLSAFLCVALHEAKIVVSGAEPLTVSDIEGHTGWSRRSLITALDHLVKGNYMEELLERGSKREKQYRVRAYAFFGSAGNSTKTRHAPDAPLHKPCGESPPDGPIVVDKDSLVSRGNLTTANLAHAKSDAERDCRRRDCLWDLGIETDEAHRELLAFVWATVEYLEDWVLHRRITGKRQGRLFEEECIEYKLGGGYYRLQIREHRQSPLQMSPAQRLDYRARKDLEWENREIEERGNADKTAT